MYKTAPLEIDSLPPADLAYMAGFIDGEGCISGSRVHKAGRVYYHPVISMWQVDPAPLNWISKKVGHGKVKVKERRGRRGHRWQVSGSHAHDLLGMLLPYLVEKRSEALAAILLWDNRIYYDRAEFLFQILRLLKQDRAYSGDLKVDYQYD